MKNVRSLSFIFKLGLLFLLAYLTHYMPEIKRDKQKSASVAYREHTHKHIS